MTESAFPIVGQDLTDAAWGQTVGATSNGILDDWGNPYAMVVNTNDTVTIKPSTTTGFARAVVNGFGHQIDANVSLTIPAVTSSTRYYVGLLYNPSNTALPVKLVVLKGATVPLSSGQAFLPLYIFVRGSGQTLAAATLYSPKPRVQPRMIVASADDLQQMDPTLFLYGTEILATGTLRTYRASGSLANPTWTAGPTQGYWRGLRTTAMANANLSAVLGFAVSTSQNAGWMTMSDQGVFTLEPGLYTVTATMSTPQRVTGWSFVQIALAGSTASLARNEFTSGDTTSTTFPLRVTNASQGYRILGYQTSGKQLNVSFSLNILRTA